MLTTVDKAWVAAVVPFVCQYVLLQFFHVTVDPNIQALIISVVTGALTWLVPNKTTAA